nr:putative reverse transcriptase domain-containing protein [Tanacetum cinerariifolium]
MHIVRGNSRNQSRQYAGQNMGIEMGIANPNANQNRNDNVVATRAEDNAQSIVTYTSISSDLDGPSWGIPLMNAGHDPEDDDEDPKEDPNEEYEPEDEDTREPSEDSDETIPFEEDETTVTPPPPRHHGARIFVRPQTPMAASTQALINAFVAGSSPFPLPPTSPAFDQAPLGHRIARIHRRDDIPEKDMPPLRRFAFTAPLPGCDIAESFAAAAREPRSQAADRAEDVGYVRALQAFERMMMTSIEEVNLRTDRRDIRLEIDVVRCQKTAYETKLQESAEDLAVTQMMHIHTLAARARTDTVKDASSSCAALTWWNGHVRTLGHDAAYAMTWGNLKKKLMDKYCPKGEIKKLEIELRLIRRIHQLDTTYQPFFPEQRIDLYSLNNVSVLLNNTAYSVKSIWRTDIQQNLKERSYALRGRDASPDSDVITGTFLLNNRYANILFNTGAYRSFVSTTFSALIDITPTTLENHYDVELADGKIIGVNTIICGCTLNFMNHPFNIDLMPIPLGSFNVIIGMDWLTKYHGVIICDEKIVRVPFRREMLIFQGNGDNQREESRLNIISCTKAQAYLSKGCDVFLAHITTKESNDKLERKRLEDVQIVRDFLEVFSEDLSGIPPAQQVEFQIGLGPGAAPVARAPYRLAPSEMKELAEQL